MTITSPFNRFKTVWIHIQIQRFFGNQLPLQHYCATEKTNRIHGIYRTQHYGDVIMGAIASQIASLTIVYSTVYSDADQRKHQSSASLAFVRVIHRGPVNSPHKWPVTQKMFPFDDVIMEPVERRVLGLCINRKRNVVQLSQLNPHRNSIKLLVFFLSRNMHLKSSAILAR